MRIARYPELTGPVISENGEVLLVALSMVVGERSIMVEGRNIWLRCPMGG
jgi:hypothetical protein